MLMANQLGSPLQPQPRSYSQHQRHRRFARLKVGANQFSQFITAQATRLSSTPTLVFGKLTKNTAARIKAAATFASLR
jgi:hypothetical protein